ncbi:MAG: hypothetical protein GWP91_00115, partial [Rhodobacterales bacterium]|nr:hypothetical protein [Rhodobacterales bacterium]
MKRLIFSLALLLSSTPALAVTYNGGDYFGTDLWLSDGDTLTGTFTNVGRLTIPAGATVTVQPGIALSISANDVYIAGDLDGTGGGEAGGFPLSDADGGAGFGLGPGEGGTFGNCVHGGGGGGGAHGGNGGDSAYYFSTTVPALGGLSYGAADGYRVNLGSGGGAGGGGCSVAGGTGGTGGASISILVNNTSTVIGTIFANGQNGPQGANPIGGSGGGGGGGGGTILLDAFEIRGTGLLSAHGGDGGPNNGGLSCGGGGGGGGRIKVYAATPVYVGADASGGLEELCTSGTNIPAPGTLGSVNFNDDPDNDGLLNEFDPCPADSGNDLDGDGYCISEGDCNDAQPTINPGVIDDCDGIDNDCDNVPGATLVGQYIVSDGPSATLNPPVYTCLETCAMLFGGLTTDYQCSTQTSSVDNMAYVDGDNDPQYCAAPGADEDFSDDLGTGYTCPGCSHSAYVSDNGCNATNYCFAPSGGVDEDGADTDVDGACDALDPCPNDADNDLDGDRLCGDVDPCPTDPNNDLDGDGLCAAVDPWPNAPNNDLDGGGHCAAVDPW